MCMRERVATDLAVHHKHCMCFLDWAVNKSTDRLLNKFPSVQAVNLLMVVLLVKSCFVNACCVWLQVPGEEEEGEGGGGVL